MKSRRDPACRLHAERHGILLVRSVDGLKLQVLAAVALGVSSAACSGGESDPGGAGDRDASTPPPRALVIGIDGVRPDALRKADTPTFDRLAAEGAATYEATTQRTTVTKSAPGWASILTGVDADKHGIQNNGDFASRDPAFVTFLQRAKTELDMRSLVVANWPGILTLVEDGAAEAEEWIPVDLVVAQTAAAAIESGGHDAYFVHLDEVDAEGHSSGFSPDNSDYLREIEEKDQQVATMLAAVEARENERWLVLVTTDHGGEGTDHGPQDAVNQTIFFIAWGPDVAPATLSSDLTHMATATTALAHLGVEPKPEWNLDGKVVGIR